MTVTTRRFAELLRDAQEWDQRYTELCHAQRDWLLQHFLIGDSLCSFVNPIDMQRWNVPRVAGGHLYTICK